MWYAVTVDLELILVRDTQQVSKMFGILPGFCYRTFPVLGWACSFPSAQQACRSFFRVIYVGGALKGPQLTTTADTRRWGICFVMLAVL